MGAFAEMFPGRKLERIPRDEDSNGQDHRFRLPDGPLDLDSGVLRLQRLPADRPAGRTDPVDAADTLNAAEADGGAEFDRRG